MGSVRPFGVPLIEEIAQPTHATENANAVAVSLRVNGADAVTTIATAEKICPGVQ